MRVLVPEIVAGVYLKTQYRTRKVLSINGRSGFKARRGKMDSLGPHFALYAHVNFRWGDRCKNEIIRHLKGKRFLNMKALGLTREN